MFLLLFRWTGRLHRRLCPCHLIPLGMIRHIFICIVSTSKLSTMAGRSLGSASSEGPRVGGAEKSMLTNDRRRLLA